MNVQLVLVLLLFSGAVVYVGRIVGRSFSSKKECGSSCKCGIDFSKVKNPGDAG